MDDLEAGPRKLALDLRPLLLLYWESFATPNLAPITRPIGLSVFPKEIMRTSERWARNRFHKLVHFENDFERGGHFAALEAPDALARELRIWRAKLSA